MIEYELPKLAMAMNEGTINEWLVADGAAVKKGDPLVTIETEKVSYDCESPEDGFFLIKLATEETVPVGTILGCFCDSEEELERVRAAAGSVVDDPVDVDGAVPPDQIAVAPSQIPTENGKHRVIASPLAKKMAANQQIDLLKVTGSGPNGRIRKRDILAYSDGAQRSQAPAATPVLARLPLTGMRGAIAKRMVASLQQAAQLSGNFEVDITRLNAVRQQFVAREAIYGTRVSMNAFLIKGLCSAIAQVPQVNACVDGEEVVLYRDVNVGIAVSVPGELPYDSGLLVPVLKQAQMLGIVEIDQQVKALIERVRSGSALKEDLTGATVTLSSTAGLAPPGMVSTPVLNRPNVYLLAPSTPVERAVLVDGELSNRVFMPISYTFDHRALDGEPAARFAKALSELLSNPELMLA